MKYTLITGASSGIGKALAYKFAKEGHNLILTARRLNLLSSIKLDIANQYDVDVVVIQADLEDSGSVDKLYASASEYELEVLINNAGLGDYGYSFDLDLQRANTMIDVNIKALMTLSLKFIKDYQDKDATLINVSSGGGYFVWNAAVTYCATKFFVSSFTEGVAQNLKSLGKPLQVKVLAPGGTTSEFVSAAESETGFKGTDLFDQSSFISAELLSDYAYDLYRSDKIVGIVNYKNEFQLKDPIFPYGGDKPPI